MDGLADERPSFFDWIHERAKQVAAAAEAAAKKAPAPRKPPAAPAAAVAPVAALTPLQALLVLCERDDRLAPVQVELRRSDVLDPPAAMWALGMLQPILRDVRGLMDGGYVGRVQADLLNVVLPTVQRLTGPHDWPAAQEFYALSEDTNHPKLHQVVADALGRCQPVAPSAGDVCVMLDALERCGAPPSDQQWEALSRAACRPSAAAGLGAGFVQEVWRKARMMARRSGALLSPGTCTALQALSDHLAVERGRERALGRRAHHFAHPKERTVRGSKEPSRRHRADGAQRHQWLREID